MCATCDWKGFAEHCEELQGDPEFSWAEFTIDAIRDTVEDREHVTDRQREAIGNIEAAVERRR